MKLQEIFNRINETKKKQKIIREVYRDALSTNAEYQEILDKQERLKNRKKEIENNLQAEMGSTFEKLDTYKLNLKMDKEMLTDVAIAYVANGQKVEVKDDFDNTYEPEFSVAFKKSKN